MNLRLLPQSLQEDFEVAKMTGRWYITAGQGLSQAEAKLSL